MSESLGKAVLDLTADNKQLVGTVAASRVSTVREFVRAAKESKLAMAAGMAAVGVAVGIGLYKVGKEFDEAYDAIQVKTGATGKKLESLKGSFRNVVRDVPADFKEAGEAIGEVNTRLGLTGKPLEDRTKQFLELSRITGTDVKTNIESVAKAFVDWEVPVKRQGKVLDGFFRLSQRSGMSVSDLASSVQKFGSPLRQLGFSLDEAAAMFANFERSGVNTQTMVPGLKLAIRNIINPTDELSKKMKEAGINAQEPKKGLQQIMEVMTNEAIPATTRTAFAMEVFGARAGADMAEAIKQGRFAVDDFIGVFRNGQSTIIGTGEDTMDLSEKMQILKNRGLLALEKPAMFVFEGLTKVADAVLSLVSAFEALPAPVRGMIGQIALVVASTLLLVFAFSKVKAAFIATRALLMANPYVALIAATVMIAYLIASNWSKIQRFLSRTWGSITSAASRAWGKVRGAIVGPLLDAARKAISIASSILQFFASLPGAFARAAYNIGISIVNGVLSGVSSLAGILRNALETALQEAIFGLSPFSPVEHGGRKYIGEPLGRGAIAGWVYGSAELPEKLSDRVKEAVDRARETVERERGKFTASWSTLADDALAAFDAIQGQIKTKSEKLLRDLQQKRNKEALLEAINNARDELVEAEKRQATSEAKGQLGEAEKELSELKQDKGESPEEFAKRKEAAEKKVADAKKAVTDAEIADTKRIKDAQKALDDALVARQEARLQREAEKERKELDARIALKRRHFQQALEALERSLTKEGATRKEANAKILALFERFGVRYKGAGEAAGAAFARGLNESRNKAAAAAEGIHKTTQQPLQAVSKNAKEAGESLKGGGGLAGAAGGAGEGLDGLAGAAGGASGKIKGLKQQAADLAKEKIGKTTEEAESKFKKLGLAIGLGTTAIIALRSAMVRSALASSFGMLVGALGKARAAFMLLNATMLLNPYVAIAAATIAIVALVVTHWDQVKAFLSGAWEKIKSLAETAWNAIKGFFSRWWPVLLIVMTGGAGAILVAIIKNWDKIKDFTEDAFDKIKRFFSKWWPVLLGVFTGGIGLIVVEVIKHWDDIKDFTAKAWDTIKDYFGKYWPILLGVFTGGIGLIVGLIIKNWDQIKEKTLNVWRAIREAVANIWDGIRTKIAAVISGVRETIANVVDGIREKMSNVWDSIRTAVGNAWEAVRDKIVNSIKGAIETVRNVIGDVVGWLADKWSAITSRVGTFADSVKEKISTAFEGAANLVIGFVNAIIDAINIIPGVDIGHVGKVGGGGGGGKGKKGGKRPAGAQGPVGRHFSGGVVNTPMAIVGEEAPRHPEYVIPTNPAYRGRAIGLTMSLMNELGIAGVPGFFLGGVLGKAVDVLSGGIGGLLDKLPSPGDYLPGWLQPMGKSLISSVTDWIGDKIGGIFGIGGDDKKMGKLVVSGAMDTFIKMFARADQIDSKHYPYVYGGGHGSFNGPYDCSGAVSAVLNAGGFLGSPITTDGLKTFGGAGDGSMVTVGVRGSTGKDAHTMMQLGAHFFESGSGHGAQWVSGWSGAFPIHRHPPGMAKGAVLGMDPMGMALLDPKVVGWGLREGGVYTGMPYLGTFHDGGVASREGLAHVDKGERMSPEGADKALREHTDALNRLLESGTTDVIEALVEVVSERQGYKHTRGRRRTASDGRMAIT